MLGEGVSVSVSVRVRECEALLRAAPCEFLRWLVGLIVEGEGGKGGVGGWGRAGSGPQRLSRCER